MDAAGNSYRDRIRGVLIGTAVGDSVGLPAEGMSRRRIGKRFGEGWRHRLLLGRGMVSDDTEQTVFVAQSLLAHPDSPDRFARRMGWCLRLWISALPAGVGFGTLRATLRLWLGFPPSRSGVFSAGNGAAMRVAPIGARFWRDPERLDRYVRACTSLTHTDPRALVGARAVARLVASGVGSSPNERPDREFFVGALRDCGPDDAEWIELVSVLADADRQGLSVQQLSERLGCGSGVTGYVYRTVPVAAYAWLRHFGDFERSLESVLDCGGDTDTTGAIVGALAGGVVGVTGIPKRWVDGIMDWPRGVPLLLRLGQRLAANEDSPSSPVRYFWPAVPARNLLFLIVVLLHGLRRLLPPY
jgi:ADP-ribosylglycohydrolase